MRICIQITQSTEGLTSAQIPSTFPQRLIEDSSRAPWDHRTPEPDQILVHSMEGKFLTSIRSGSSYNIPEPLFGYATRLKSQSPSPSSSESESESESSSSSLTSKRPFEVEESPIKEALSRSLLDDDSEKDEKSVAADEEQRSSLPLASYSSIAHESCPGAETLPKVSPPSRAILVEYPIYMDMLREYKSNRKRWQKDKKEYEDKHHEALKLFEELIHPGVLNQAEEEFKTGSICDIYSPINEEAAYCDLCNRWESNKLRAKEDVQTFFSRMERLANQFNFYRHQGATIPTDQIKKVYANKRLMDHPKYDQVIKDIFHRSMDLRDPLSWLETQNLVRARLEENETRERLQAKKNKHLSTRKSTATISSSTSSEVGMTVAKPSAKNEEKSKSSKPIECFYCHKVGHKANQCPEKRKMKAESSQQLQQVAKKTSSSIRRLDEDAVIIVEEASTISSSTHHSILSFVSYSC
eukprot:scaffold212_cov174-Ochromonas_danica.AAC.18